MILLAEHDEPSLAAKKKQRHVASETATSTPKNRVWNFFGSPLGRTCSDPDLSAETATGSVQFSYKTASGRGYYYTRDQIASVREMMDSSGTIVSRLGYDPYGKTTVVSGTNLPAKGYAGMYWHQASQDYLTINRIYRPDVALWDSRDPLMGAERSQGPNLYEYVGNNPISHIDPLGLKVYLCCAPIEAKTFLSQMSNACGFRHCWLKTDSKEAGMGPSPPSKTLPSNPLGQPTEINDETGDSKSVPGTTCTEIPDANEACVNRELQIGKATGKWEPNNNCNTLAFQILAKCGSCKYNTSPPKPGSTFPAPIQ